MPDLSRLETLIGRLAEKDFAGANEPATCEIAVLPVIGALGWDTDDFDEVRRQYPVKDIDGKEGSVDYCLYAKGRPYALIEAKRAEAELSRHQAQLLRYAYQEGVELAALTNGLDWWLYLPMVGGEQVHRRRFSSVNLREQTYPDSAAMLHRFLNRDCVVSGEAKSEAEREFESQKRNRLVESALPEAWRRVDGNNRLGDLLAEVVGIVEEHSGHTPDREAITGFMQDKLGRIGEDGVPRTGTPTETGTERTTQSPKLGRRSPKARRDANKPQAFWLDGLRYEVGTSRAILRRICEILVQEDLSVFEERVLRIDRKPPLFSESREAIKHPNHVPGSRLYVNGYGSAKRIEQKVRHILRAVRGSDDGFCVERADPPRDS